MLLDTHSLLWFVLDDPKLSAAAGQAIASADNEILISPASYWEIAIKVSLGKYQLHGSFASFWETVLQQNDIGVLPIEVRHAACLSTLPFHHKDPFDRLLVAQALTEEMPLVTIDARIEAYGIMRVW